MARHRARCSIRGKGRKIVASSSSGPPDVLTSHSLKLDAKPRQLDSLLFLDDVLFFDAFGDCLDSVEHFLLECSYFHGPTSAFG